MPQWVASDEGIRTENFLAMIIQKLYSTILRIRVTDSYCLIQWMKWIDIFLNGTFNTLWKNHSLCFYVLFLQVEMRRNWKITWKRNSSKIRNKNFEKMVDLQLHCPSGDRQAKSYLLIQKEKLTNVVESDEYDQDCLFTPLKGGAFWRPW